MEARQSTELKNFQLKDTEIMKAQGFNQKIIEEYKKLVPTQEHIEVYTDLDTTTRFLIARKFNEKKAIEMWTNWRKWRIEYKVDNITEVEIENELKMGKAFFHGYDKENRPCLVIKVKRHRPGQISVEETVRYGVYLIEKGIKLAEARGSDKMVVIYDREGFENKNFDKKLATVMRSLLTILQDYYAERLAKMYVLFPNWFYKLMFGVVKPFMDEKTKKKILLVNKVEELQKDFDRSELLIEHGGTSTYQYAWPPNSTPIVDEPTSANPTDDSEQVVPDNMIEAVAFINENQISDYHEDDSNFDEGETGIEEGTSASLLPARKGF